MFDYVKFGNFIRQERKNKHMTQAQLALAIDKSVSFLGHIERGSRKASLETAKDICDFLNISMDEACKISTPANKCLSEAKTLLALALFLASDPDIALEPDQADVVDLSRCQHNLTVKS